MSNKTKTKKMKLEDLTTPIPELAHSESITHNDYFYFKDGSCIYIEIIGVKMIKEHPVNYMEPPFNEMFCDLTVYDYTLYNEEGDELSDDIEDFIKEFEKQLNLINS